mmetsp:Transcript_77956/g.241632  ORF Transcript_77956/g.241632 Transcript_77956/m.241632 type:complete len:486 (+) Transcript_77956:199-1656(+)
MHSQLDSRVLVRARGDLLASAARVLDGDAALDDDILGKRHFALDDKLLASNERRGPAGDELLHRIGELVHAVKLNGGGHAAAGLGQHDAEVWCEDVGVGAEGEKVVRRLHRREARAGDDERGRALEAFDRRAHRRLQLQHLRGRLVARIHRLGVLHDRQWQGSAMLRELLLERLQVDPQVVRVEELVPRGVLEGLLVLLGALRGLAEQQAAALLLLGQVPALLVRLGAVGHFHHEGGAGAHEVGQDLEIHGRAQVVGVGHEHVLEAVPQELVERAAAQHCRVQVPVARGAPLVPGLLLPVGRGHVGGGDLGRLVLDELKVGARAEVGVLGQSGQGVGGRRERVHEHELEVHLVGLLHGCHLLGGQVQEAVAIGDGEEGLGLVQAHAGPQAAVQLQDDRLGEQRGVLRDGELLEPGQGIHAVERALRDHHVRARDEHGEVVLESGDRRLVAPLLLHLGLVGRPVFLHGRHLEEGRARREYTWKRER